MVILHGSQTLADGNIQPGWSGTGFRHCCLRMFENGNLLIQRFESLHDELIFFRFDANRMLEKKVLESDSMIQD